MSRWQVAELIAAAVADPSTAENKVLEVVAEETAPLRCHTHHLLPTGFTCYPHGYHMGTACCLPKGSEAHPQLACLLNTFAHLSCQNNLETDGVRKGIQSLSDL